MKPPQRPVGALVIAILNFVFGGFNLLGVMCIGLEVLGFVILFSNMPPPQAPVAGAPAKPDPMHPFRELGDGMSSIPGIIPYATVTGVKSVITPFLLLISGYGLVKIRRYGRTLAIFYAILALVFVVIDAAYGLAFLNEGFVNAYQRYFDALMAMQKGAPGAPPPPVFNIKQMMSPGMMVGSTIFSALIYSAYPIAILAVMFRRDVRTAYSGIAPVILPSERSRSERSDSPEEEEVEDALPGARPALEDGIKEATDPGVRPPREDA
jgi:hypothetical protein